MNIYGSQDAFLKVYKSMLEERLLGVPRQLQETELKNLELMKLRFGSQGSLHACDVMMRDVKDSERIRVAVSKAMGGGFLNTLILSKGYWDTEEPASFAPPAFLKKAFEEFAFKY